MALSPISVNYRSLFANGTLSAASAGTTWIEAVRIADHFVNRIAKTAGVASGLTEIKIDQGATVANYVSPNRLIIPARHNLGVALTLAFSATDTWPGTTVTLSPSATPVAGTLFSATFPKVTAASGNRWWRLSFTKTDAVIEIPEVWVTQKIELGESETGLTEPRGPEAPMDFPVRRNIEEIITREGSRAAVEIGTARRQMVLQSSGLGPTAFGDWEAFLVSTSYGLRPFFVDDPRGATWFATVDLAARSLTNPERWTVEMPIVEIP